MAICMEPCCNAEARARVKAEKEAAFEAWLMEMERDTTVAVKEPVVVTVTLAPTAEENDLSYEDAKARLDSLTEGQTEA